MSARDDFVHYVKHGGDKPAVSLQIGAGAGFDSKLAGKDWITETTLDDTIRACEAVGGLVLLNIGLPDLGRAVPELAWKTETDQVDLESRTIRARLETPYGVLERDMREKRFAGVTPVKYPLTFGDGLDVVYWMADQHEKAVPHLAGMLAPTVESVRRHGAVSVQWNIQPFEIFGLANAIDQVMMLTSDPDTYRALCDRVRDVNIALVKEAFKAGADFVFVGGPGSEAASPLVYEEFLVPDSRAVSEAAHQAGGLIYSHICSPIEPFLSSGYYGQMGFDLFETLSPPPVGNVADLAAARRLLPPEMCTRGNLGLDLLLNGTVKEVEARTLAIIEETRGYKHMVAASDYLFRDIPLENARAVVRTVENA